MKHFRHILFTAISIVLVVYPFSPLLKVNGKDESVEAAAKLPSTWTALLPAWQQTVQSLPASFILINNNDKFTRDGAVNIDVFMRARTDKIAVLTNVRYLTCTTFNDCKTKFAGEVGFASWQDLTSAKLTTISGVSYVHTQLMLSSPQSSGMRGLCVQVMDSSNKVSPRYTNSCDNITLDNLAPTGSAVINDGAAETHSLDLWAHVSATDPKLADLTVGVGKIEYTVRDDTTSWDVWKSLTSSTIRISGHYPTPLTQPTVIHGYVKFRDSLGNESKVYSDDILYSPNTTAQVGKNVFSINDGAAFTESQTVSLHLVPAKPVSSVKIWNRGTNSDQVAVTAYTENLSWKLTNGYEQKQVYALFNFTDGTNSGALMSQIIYAPQYAIQYFPALASYSEFTLGTLPNVLSASVNVNMVLSVKNTGSLEWLSNSIAKNADQAAVHISYHWYKLNADGTRSLVTYQGNRAELNNKVAYNYSDPNVRFSITTPDEPGRYVLQFDAVRESPELVNVEFRTNLGNAIDSGDWFSNYGNPTPETTINIVPQMTTDAAVANLQLAVNPFRSQSLSNDLRSALIAPQNATNTYYTVREPREYTWHCGGYDCYSGIANDFYGCTTLGIPNDVPDTTDENQMRNKCWWPIYNANRGLYAGLNLPYYYATHPWQYLLPGWVLLVPANPWTNGGGTNPPVDPGNGGTPTLPAPPGNFNGIPGATPQDPYAGLNGANTAHAQVTFDRFVAWDGSYKTDQIKWSETSRPQAPTVTGITTSGDGKTVTIFGVGIPKGHSMKIGVWNEFRYCWACGSGWEYFSQNGTAQNVKIALFTGNWQFLGYVWNDRADGRWNITLPLGGNLHSGDSVFAELQIEADYTFSGLHWWSDTTETVNFNLRNPKYTGYPYFASGASNSFPVPAKAYTNDADWAIAYRESNANFSAAGALHQYCGAWIKDYYGFNDNGDTWWTYTNLIYNPAKRWAFRLRGDIRLAYWNKYNGTCGTLGLPTTDDLWAATGPLGTTGAYQKFDNGTIHSSDLGTFATTGKLNEVHTNGGGTAKYGFPRDEMYKQSNEWCQDFEMGTLCESGLVDKRSDAEKAIDSRAKDLGSKGASLLMNICSQPAKTYTEVITGEDGAIIYVNGGTVYTYGGTWDTFNYYQDKCSRFGVPVDDPKTGGVGPFNTPGAYQDFQQGRIYWSFKYQGKFVYGIIGQKYETAGGTNSFYGWPTDEVRAVNENGVSTNCQNFEGGRICEKDIPAPTEAQLAFEAKLGRSVLPNEIVQKCGFDSVALPDGIAIYDSNTKEVKLVTGEIYKSWVAKCTAYGFPENDTDNVNSGVSDTKGNTQRFNRNVPFVYDFYYSKLAPAAIVLEGTARNLYNSAGGLGSVGFPTADPYNDAGRGWCIKTENSTICEREVDETGPTCHRGFIMDKNDCIIEVTTALVNSLKSVALTPHASGRYSLYPDKAEDTTRKLLSAINKYKIKDKNYLAYIFASSQYESNFGTYMTELADGWAYDLSVNPGIAAQLGNTEVGDGPKFKGRGYVQITGRKNYQREKDRTGINLIDSPNTLADNHDLAADVTVHGMLLGSFTGRKLEDYYTLSGSYDFVNARAIINGDVRANGGSVADIANHYLQAFNNYL